LPYNKNNLEQLLNKIVSSDNYSFSAEMGVKLLKSIGVEKVENFMTYVTGTLKEKYSITLWIGSYGKNVFGVRFGYVHLKYQGSNDTYFEVAISKH